MFVAAAPVAAQDDAPLIGDRPDFTESPNAVPRLQLEGGYTLTHAGGASDHAIGEFLLRVPLFAAVEGRLGFGSFVALDIGGGTSGYGGPSIGVKWQLAEARDAAPDLGILLGTTIPAGSSALGVDEWVPEVRFAAAWGGAVSLSTNVGLARVTGGDPSTVFLGSIAAGVGLGERRGAFLELYGTAADDGDQVVVDGGLTWLATPDWQFDVRGGFSLENGDGPTEYTLGAGFVVRR